MADWLKITGAYRKFNELFIFLYFPSCPCFCSLDVVNFFKLATHVYWTSAVDLSSLLFCYNFFSELLFKILTRFCRYVPFVHHTLLIGTRSYFFLKIAKSKLMAVVYVFVQFI